VNIFDAVSFGTVEDLVAALRSGEDPNQYDTHSLTPLHWAMSRFGSANQDVQKIKLLLEAHADPNAPSNNGGTPIVDAITYGQMELIELLLSYGASIKSESDVGSLIADAVLGSQLTLIPYLVNKGVDVNLISRDGFTPLMLAAGNGVEDAIPILLAAGAQVDLRDTNHGLTAYLHAAVAGNKVAARILLAAGANPRATANNGKNACALAEEEQHAWDEFEVDREE